MFCENCGAKIADDVVFCENCGAKVVTNTSNKMDIPFQYGENNYSDTNVKASLPAIPKMAFVIAIEIVLLIVAIVFSKNMVGKNYAPEKLAEKYFVSIVNGDTDTAFEMLGLTEHDFINKEAFSNSIAMMNLGEVSNYKIVEDRMSQYEDEYYQSKQANDNIIKPINIEYTYAGETSSLPFQVILNKASGKKMLFFDNWSIASSNLMINDVNIVAPKGATVTFDDVQLDDSYCIKDENYNEDLYDVYAIRNLFMGKHKIKFEKEGYETKEQCPLIDSNDYTAYCGELFLTEDKANEIQNIALENIKKIYNSAFANASFDEVKDLFGGDKDNIKRIQEDYKSLVNYFHDGNVVVNEVEIKNITIESTTYNPDTEIKFDYVVKYTTSSGLAKTRDGSANCYCNMELEDGNWVQTVLGARQLGYLSNSNWMW